MSVRIDAAADRLLRSGASGPIDTNAAYTWMGWFYFVSLPTTRYSTCWIAEALSNASSCDYFQINSSASHRIEWGMSVVTTFTSRTGTTAITTGTWYHFALVRASGTSLQGYINGVAEGAEITTTIGSRTSAANTNGRMEMGAYDTGNVDQMDGRIAYVTMWNRVLSAAEILDEMKAARPRHPSSVWGFWPLWQNQRGKDLSGNGRDWTEGGTLTDEDPPPVSYGSPQWIVIAEAAAAGDATFTAQVATATALSPVAAVTAGATVTALVTTATALSPVAAMTGGAALAAAVATATALSPAAALTSGSVLTAGLTTATALSPAATFTAGAALVAQPATATAQAPVADVSAGSAGSLLAQAATATALAPTASLLAGALFSGLVGAATALAPVSTFATGSVFTALTGTATGLALVASIVGFGPAGAASPGTVRGGARQLGSINAGPRLLSNVRGGPLQEQA